MLSSRSLYFFRGLSNIVPVSTTPCCFNTPIHKSGNTISWLEKRFNPKRLILRGLSNGGNSEEKDDAESLSTLISQASNNFFQSIGTPVPFVMAPLVNPASFGITWPGQPRWIGITLDPVGGLGADGFAYASDCLSYPWDDEEIMTVSKGASGEETREMIEGEEGKDYVGLGFELIVGSFELRPSALLSTVNQVSTFLVSNSVSLEFLISLREDEKKLLELHPEMGISGSEEGKEFPNDIDDGLIILGSMSTEVNGDEFPKEMCNPDTGNVGILIHDGITAGLPRAFSLPTGKETRVLELVVLHPQELQHIVTCGLPARMEISRRLRALGTKWCSSSSRQSVVSVLPPNEQCRTITQAIDFVKEWPHN